jgi:hypothetical protein
MAANHVAQDDVESAQLMCELFDSGSIPMRSYRSLSPA